MVTRRQFLGTTVAAGLFPLLPRLTFAGGRGDSRLVVVILRGALDGLHAVPAPGDRDFQSARGALASADLLRDARHLDDLFALHPALENMHALYVQGELTVFHAVATPYRDRSHFDGQDLLENGTAIPHGAQDGWLNRALLELAGQGVPNAALALGQNVPLILRGSAPVTTWAPSRLPDVDEDLYGRLAKLYADDDLLARRLAEGMATEAVAAGQGMGGGDGAAERNPQRGLGVTMEAAAKFLAVADGPRIAVMDSTGWDTHANEEGTLALRLRSLDAGIDALHRGLGAAWARTAVLVVTEFGRTVAVNGSRGADHGTAGAAFLLGGAVAGGRVIADWPGLRVSDLHEGRDLRPTLDMRRIFKGLLRESFDLGDAALANRVFPGSGAVPPLQDLLRA